MGDVTTLMVVVVVVLAVVVVVVDNARLPEYRCSSLFTSRFWIKGGEWEKKERPKQMLEPKWLQ